MINRSSIILNYKEPAIEWINAADPYNEDPGINIDDVNNERIVYLVREEDAEGSEAVKEWVSLNYEVLFENELDGWYTDESLWPKERTLELFYKWFDVECHSMIIDTVGTKIEDDGI